MAADFTPDALAEIARVTEAATPGTISTRPFRHLCPEADLRDAMTDAEFWDHVFPGDGRDEEPYEVVTEQLTECPICHEFGPCGYDEAGRPMIHATDPDDD